MSTYCQPLNRPLEQYPIIHEQLGGEGCSDIKAYLWSLGQVAKRSSVNSQPSTLHPLEHRSSYSLVRFWRVLHALGVLSVFGIELSQVQFWTAWLHDRRWAGNNHADVGEFVTYRCSLSLQSQRSRVHGPDQLSLVPCWSCRLRGLVVSDPA